MFERFSDKARRTVVLAQEEATLLEHDHIGTEHILLGLLRETGGAAASVLTSLGVSLEAARASVESADGRGPGAAGHIPFTPEAKRTLELALREALQLGHDYIGTGHILLGLTTDPGYKGAEVLTELGAGLDAVRAGVVELRPASEPRGVRRTQPATGVESASRFADLTARLAAVERRVGTAPNLAGLDAQIARMRRRKEAAIDAQDFRQAEALSDSETSLLVERDRQARDWTQRPSLGTEVAQLRAEVERLRAVLREHGLDADEAS
jgi:ATP-dependent Clp protease ATP-binding subunit ClpC